MKIGLYIFAGLLLIIVSAAFAYTINPTHFGVEMLGVRLNLPVAIWVVLPALLLFLFTVFHMFFYGIKNYLLLKKWQKDAITLDDALYWSLVKEPKEQNYFVAEMREIAPLLNKAQIDLKEGVDGLNPRLSKVIRIIEKIKNGEYVDLKEEKMHKVFSSGNPILMQNRLNRLHADTKFVQNVMKGTESYSAPVRKKALELYANSTDFEQAKQFASLFDKESFFLLLSRVDEENMLSLTPETLSSFVKHLPLKCRDFVKIAQITKKYFNPNDNLSLFKQYQNEYPEAQKAYLYLLFEYEMNDEIQRYLEEFDEKEFVKFRALVDLKDAGKAYMVKELLETSSVC